MRLATPERMSVHSSSIAWSSCSGLTRSRNWAPGARIADTGIHVGSFFWTALAFRNSFVLGLKRTSGALWPSGTRSGATTRANVESLC